jgi:hypothetical protein
MLPLLPQPIGGLCCVGTRCCRSAPFARLLIRDCGEMHYTRENTSVALFFKG